MRLDLNDSRVRNSTRMSVAVLFPHYHHPAIEERYASWQSELLLRTGDIHYYGPDEPAVDAISGVNAEFVLVIADPLLLPAPLLGQRLAALLGGAFAAVPVSNEAEHPRQRITAPVPVVLTGDTSAVTDAGGIIEQQLSELSVACQADHLPEQITVDVSGLQIGHAIHISDLDLPEGVEPTQSPDTVVVAAAMTAAGRAIRAAVKVPIGFNVLRNDARAALALCTACGGSFIRVNVHTGAMLTETQQYLQVAPFLAIIPGCAIVVSALGFNLIGDALREALDPKLRGRT